MEDNREPDATAPVTPADKAETNALPRREALARLGKYAAYTAPALLAILTPDRARAALPSRT